MPQEQHRRRLNTGVATKEQWGDLIQTAEALGIEEALKRLKTQDEHHKIEFYEKQETNNDFTISHYSELLRSVEDLIQYHKVDTEIWEQHKLKTNYWEVGMKLKRPDGTHYPVVNPLHQITVEWKRKTMPGVSKDIIVSWLEQAYAQTPTPATEPKQIVLGDCALEIMIPDLHIGAIGVKDDWSYETIRKVWFNAIKNFLSDKKNIGTVILPIGNDFLHIDNLFGTTTRGTQMEYSSNWFKSLIFAAELVNDTIAMFPAKSNIIVPFVYGNHDTHATLSLHEIVRSKVGQKTNVKFPEPNLNGRQYVSFGKNLLAYMHGDVVRNTNIQAVVSSECEFWTTSKYRFARVGHLHKRAKDVWSIHNKTNEINGLEIETCPSLKPTDSWHDKMAFIGNMRRATAFVYHKDEGLIRQLFYNL
jgi:hypothetical protein